MRSMTGFGRAQSRDGSEVIVRAVNGRFLELRVHLPKDYLELESQIRTEVGNHCRRGTIDVYVNPSPSASTHSPVVNRSAAEDWYKALREVARVGGLNTDDVSPERILNAAGVVSFAPNRKAMKSKANDLMRLVTQATAQCVSERNREGKTLQKQLLQFVQDLEKSVLHLETQMGRIPEKIRSKIQARLEKILGTLSDRDGHGLSPERLHQEVALLAERADVSEEIERLKTHLEQYRKLVLEKSSGVAKSESEQGIGKRLDFYTQELLREINTIGSKVSEVEVTQEVVKAKSTIEKLREQVQNVE